MTATNTLAKHPSRALRPRGARRSLARFVRVLQAQLPELTSKHHLKSLGVFGSYVQYQERARSDLDVLVEFSPENGLPSKLALAKVLSKALGVKVDVVQREGLPYYIGKRVLREVIWLQKDGVALPVRLPRRKRAHANGKRNGALMEPKREYLDYLQDMLDSMAKVQRIVAGITMEEMIANLEKDWAVRYGFLAIGEAANRVPRDIQKMYPQLPWQEIIKLRNAMAHGYDRMMYTEIWTAIKESIPRDELLVAQMLADEKKRRGVDKDQTENQEPTA